MNVTLIAVFSLLGTLSDGKDPDVLFRAPHIRVKQSVNHGPNPPERYNMLLYNGINMGTNFHKPNQGSGKEDLSRLATTYFHSKSPVGIALQKFNWFPGPPDTYWADARLPASLFGSLAGDVARCAGGMPTLPWTGLVDLWSEPPIAVLGMDVGTQASYARPLQTIHFTERVPEFVPLSLPKPKQNRYFRYVQDALDRGAGLKIFEGEPRPTFEKHGGKNFYHLIVVESYKVPVSVLHEDLMTKEGMQMLMSGLSEEGVLCYHVSNQHYNLVPIVASVANHLNLAAVVGRDHANNRERGAYSSVWVMVARKQEYLAHLKAPEGYDEAGHGAYWSAPKRTEDRFVWTDKGQHSLRGLYYSDPVTTEFSRNFPATEQGLMDLGFSLKAAQSLTAPYRGVVSGLGSVRLAILNGGFVKPERE